MRQHYQVVGKIAAAAVENGDRIANSFNKATGEDDDDHVGVEVHANGMAVHILSKPEKGYFEAIAVRRFSFLDGFDPNELPTVQAAEQVVQHDRFLTDFDGRIVCVEYQGTNADAALFDGVQVHHTLYPYADDFGLQEYRRAIREVKNRSRTALDLVADRFDVAMDADEAVDEEEDAADDLPSFQ
jgi:hypothetical protein